MSKAGRRARMGKGKGREALVPPTREAELHGAYVRDGTFVDANDATQEDALDAARAALEAMRDPTPEMVEAGANAHDYGGSPKTIGHGNARRNVQQIWSAMITAALAPQE